MTLPVVDVEASPLPITGAGCGSKDGADRGQKLPHLAEADRLRGPPRIDACPPQRLGGIDVPDPRQTSLVKKEHLDRDAAGAEAFGKPRRIERGIIGIRPHAGNRIHANRAQFDSTERPGIVEHDARSVIEAQARPRISRDEDVGREHPVASHSKVRVKDATVFEVDQLVFPPATDPGHSRTDHRTELTRTQATPERGMVQVQRDDPPADQMTPERHDGAFDFGKLGHR